MKAAPLLINWHNENQAIYSVHFDPHGKGRLATAGLYVILHFTIHLLTCISEITMFEYEYLLLDIDTHLT